MATTQPRLAAELAETAAATPRSIAAIFDAANRELTARGTAPGLDVGDAAPEFALPDQVGRVVSLGEQLAHGPRSCSKRMEPADVISALAETASVSPE